MAPRKTTPRSKATAPANDLRARFEQRLEDVRARFKGYEKDWSKTVDRLVARGRTAERDLRSRLDKVSRDLNKSPLLERVRKNPTFRRFTSVNLFERVKELDYEKAVNEIRRDVKGLQNDVVDFFQSSKDRLKQVIDLPTRTDFERLNKKIDQLSTQVRSIERRKRA